VRATLYLVYAQHHGQSGLTERRRRLGARESAPPGGSVSPACGVL
jgi:hypothetical protein